MASVRDRIDLLADIFLGAAHADLQFHEVERTYVRDLLLDLLSATTLPAPLARRIDEFDPRQFDLLAAARDFAADPPMSRRRLLELVAYVTLSDGDQDVEENAYVRALGEALGLAPEDYQDLTSARIRMRHSFIDLARVPLPSAQRA